MVVIHEANLHHLIADITIKRGDWDAYMRAVEQEGSPAEIWRTPQRVRRLEVGPGLRRCADAAPACSSRSKAAIVHSGCVETRVARARDFRAPVARIPHGAWIPDANRSDFRERLGLDETTPLIGIFGYLEAVQAHCRIAARFSPAGARGAVGQNDSGGRAASGAALWSR